MDTRKRYLKIAVRQPIPSEQCSNLHEEAKERFDAKSPEKKKKKKKKHGMMRFEATFDWQR